MRIIPAFLTVLLVISVTACADDDSELTPDSGPVGADLSGLPDGLELFECKGEGTSCNAHDPCAINAVCKTVCVGGDAGCSLKCVPQGYQACNDGLECTDDICLGQGKCDHKPRAGFCALPVKPEGSTKTEVQCFAAEMQHPLDSCKACDPENNPSRWSAANGGACDDGNACTKDDYCDNGACKGTYYGDQCQDTFGCTDDLCDGMGGCLGNPLKQNACLINGECFDEGDVDPNACNVCEPAQSQSTWTALVKFCKIDGQCYKPSDKDVSQCSVCDPDQAVEAWTALPGLCKIDSQCYQKGDVNTFQGGCGECDPDLNATGWSVKGDACFVDGKCHKPGDVDATGCGACDPTKDKFAFSALANKCLVGGKCFDSGDKDPTGCGECDPTANSSGWTVKGDACLIAGLCYQPKDKNENGCAVCDPTASKTEFTPVGDKCTVGLFCYADQETDADQCLVCDVAAKPNGWTAKGATKLTRYDFEDGTAGEFKFTQSDAKVGWVVSQRKPIDGTYSLYYGDDALGNYQGSGKNNGTAESPEYTLAAGKKAGLRFWLYMDTEAGSGFDKLTVSAVEGTTATLLWQKNNTNPGPGTQIKMKQWNEIVIDLAAYAGKKVKLQFTFDTVDGVGNTGQGALIDNIALFHDC